MNGRSGEIVPACTNREGSSAPAKDPGGSKKQKTVWVKNLTSVDAFSLEAKDGSIEGGVITALVWSGSIIYIALMVTAWLNAPPIKTNTTECSGEGGPYPLVLTCVAQSGCLVSNQYTNQGLGRVAVGSDGSRGEGLGICQRLEPNETQTFDMRSSVNPDEGLSILFDPATQDPSVTLLGAGVIVTSDMRCLKPQSPKDCISPMLTPLRAGTSLLQYVLTNNYTASGKAVTRHEWFANVIDQQSSVVSDSTPCWNSSNSLSSEMAGWAQM